MYRIRLTVWRTWISSLCGLLASLYVGNVESANQLLRLPNGSESVMLAEKTQVFGVPALVQVFDSPESLVSLLQWFSKHYPYLKDLTVLPGQAVLSGQSGLRISTVTMEGLGAKRTVGTIAHLDYNAVAQTRPNKPSWISAAARLYLDLSFQEEDQHVVQQIWYYPFKSITEVRHDVIQQLRRSNWIQLSDSQQEAMEWQKNKQQLQLYWSPLDRGVGMVYWLKEARR